VAVCQALNGLVETPVPYDKERAKGIPKVAVGMDASALFKERLDLIAANTEDLLDRLLALGPVAGELARPARLVEAMRYASLGGGKRFRPFLVVEAAALFGVPEVQSLMVAAALECIHCYSLVHDDLPAMDNDDLRRGRPTAHKAYDEATAILAGDALLTIAFDILSRPEVHPNATVRIDLVSALARFSGLGGMVGGQILDLGAEGRFGDGRPRQLNLQDVEVLQGMKTGALLRFGCLGGAILGEADGAQCGALDRYGSAVGKAFQIADDLLDLEGDPATVGKATGKDAAAHKATVVSLLGVAEAKRKLAELVSDAEAALAPFGEKGAVLKAAAHFVADRRS
jgi:farnesyl diphosphate synthase